MEKIIGSKISAADALNNLEFVRKSKDEAKKYEWLYHCTSVEALISVIENREMWLSNLKVVNDKEEVGRIDVEEYEKAYYVACFTYDSDITDEHWREYGQSENKVLFGVKTSWFKKKLSFLDTNHTKIDDNCFKICNSFDEAIDYQVKSIKNGKNVPPPYYVIDYGFYKVIYDDVLKKNIKSKATWMIDGVHLEEAAIVPTIPGIIKSTHGICIRNGKDEYDKDWTSEKEVRLKIGVNTNNKQIKDIGVFYRQMAIQLSDIAFSELPIKFSPDMKLEQREKSLKRIKSTLPGANVYEI